jgi:hypothetical protein
MAYTAQTEIPRKPLAGEEPRSFNKFWNGYSMRYTNQGVFKFTPDRYRNAAVALCEAFKLKTDRYFQGSNATSGFGIRRIMPEDVMGILPGTGAGAGVGGNGIPTWDITWTTQGTSDWFSSLEPGLAGAAPFGTGNPIRNVDANNATEIWYVGMWGVSDIRANAGNIRRIFFDLHGNDQAYKYVEYDLRANEQRVSWFDQTVTLLHQPYQVGVDVLTANVISSLFPEGVTVHTSIRAKDRNNNQLQLPTV